MVSPGPSSVGVVRWCGVPAPLLLRPGVQGLGGDLGGANPPADVDLDRGSRRGLLVGHVGQADPDLERRREGTARDDAATDDLVAGTRDPAIGEAERYELQPVRVVRVLRVELADRADRLGADEAGVLLAAPAEAGADRVAILGEVVAVEVEAGLEPKRVAGAESGGQGAGRAASPRSRGRRRAAAAARRRPPRCSRCRRPAARCPRRRCRA